MSDQITSSGSADDGIGVPFNPVRIRRKTSAGVLPERNVPEVKSRGMMASSRQSRRLYDEDPSPRPSGPWQATHDFM